MLRELQPFRQPIGVSDSLVPAAHRGQTWKRIHLACHAFTHTHTQMRCMPGTCPMVEKQRTHTHTNARTLGPEHSTRTLARCVADSVCGHREWDEECALHVRSYTICVLCIVCLCVCNAHRHSTAQHKKCPLLSRHRKPNRHGSTFSPRRRTLIFCRLPDPFHVRRWRAKSAGAGIQHSEFGIRNAKCICTFAVCASLLCV